MKQTAGEKAFKASRDRHIYDPLDVAHGLCDDIPEELFKCAGRHESIFAEEEYFVCLLVCGDPLIHGVRRHKFYALLHMPNPRPNQAVFLYNKTRQSMYLLWALPDAKNMAILSEMPWVTRQWERTKVWCDAFFNRKFHETIREQHHITHLSENEFSNVHAEKLVQARSQYLGSRRADPFNIVDLYPDQVISAKESEAKECALRAFREA